MAELTIERALKHGIEAHKAGKVREADRLYTAILKAQPNHPDANHNLGVLAVGVGKVQEALPFFKKALEASPATEQFWLSYIDALIRLDQLANAKAVLEQAKSKGAKGFGFSKLEQQLNETSEKPPTADRAASKARIDNTNILDSLKLDQAIKLANKKFKDGSSEEAMLIYQDILIKFPKNKRAIDGIKELANRTVTKASKVQEPPKDQLQTLINLCSQGQLQKAVEQAGNLIKRFPQSAILFNVQGVALKGLGQFELSLEAYNKALAINPNYAEAYNNMGNALKDQGKLEEAIEAYEKTLEIKPDNAGAYNNMGIALKDQGKPEQAVEAYNKALAINPNYAEAYNNMGVSHQEQGKLEEAIEAYKKTLDIKPNHPEAYYNMGVALKDQGKLEEAIEAYNKALAITPDNSDAYNNIGNALKDQGKLEEAVAAYNKALTIKPDNAGYYYNIGIAFKEQDKLAEALKAYNKALAIKPDNAGAYNNMGIALKDQGKLEEAIEAYNKALAINPDNVSYYYNMGIALKDQGKLEEAIEVYNKALAINPNNSEIQHIVSSLTGQTTTSPPRKYVENLFDGYSKKFEKSLVKDLEYKIPKLLTKLIVKEHGNGQLGSVLDLGCGTGLTGLEIKDFCSNLEGVDLSKKMLELANSKNVYEKLVHSDILDYLSGADLNFDYFIATDVLVYLGDLTEFFRLIKSRNQKNGKLAFSTEKNIAGGFQLETSGRYSHSKSYIEGLCEEFNYSESFYSEVDLRKEKGTFLTGGLYILSF